MKCPDDFGISDAELSEVTVPNTLADAKEPEREIMEALAANAYDEQAVFAIKLALEEALTNAIKHGNRNEPDRRLTVRYAVQPDRAVIAVRDEGEGFSPEMLPDPTADENLELPNGRGIMLMFAYMTMIRFNDAGNEVWMLKTAETAP